jgi:hypothetical protein
MYKNVQMRKTLSVAELGGCANRLYALLKNLLELINRLLNDVLRKIQVQTASFAIIFSN